MQRPGRPWKKRSKPAVASWIVLILLLTTADAAHAGDANATNLASAICDAARFTGGLIVHVDCSDGQLTAALQINDRSVVHGLDADGADVVKARNLIRSLGIYGPVSVERWQETDLPYADRMVNLLVLQDTGREIRVEEIMRVLAPGGVAVTLVPGMRSLKPEIVCRKPWPDSLDQWTHFLHDPDNNAVARDAVVGPPKCLQWMAGPVWSKEHDVTPSVFAPVSCNGRLFYILNEGPHCAIDPRLPDRYSVVARDAFNGVLLWKRPMTDWYSSRVIWGHIPMHSQRRLVATGDRVYVTLGLQAPVSALDAATGELVREYPGTARTSEILSNRDKLVLVTRKTHPLDGLLAGRDGNRFRKGYAGPQQGREEVLVVSERSGECLWRNRRACMPLTLAVAGQRVLFAEAHAVVCLDLDTGKQMWTAPCEAVRTLVVHGNTVLTANADRRKITLSALDLESGQRLWNREAGSLPNFLFFFGPLDVFVAHDLVWGLSEGLEYIKQPGSGHLLGLDLRSGEIRRRIPMSGAFTTEHHVRCYKGKATEDYLLLNKRGIEFVGLEPNQPPVPNGYQWVRGTCRYGILPCNGLIYAPPHACACYPGAKVNGFLALSAGESKAFGRDLRTGDRLQRGPAYGRTGNRHLAVESPPAWPTYRGDRRRSGHALGSVPDNPAILWKAQLGTKLSSPVVAEGKVLAAAVDEYTLHASSADDGRALWSYTTAGRIDSPPTIHNGTAVFGCRDGWVYCVRLDDGELVWRFRAAPHCRRVGAFGRLESPWPVHGSVLVKDGVVYFAAGTSSFLDGGLYVDGLDAATGELRYQTRLRGPDPQAATSRVTAGRMPGAVPDILTCDDAGLYLRHVKLDWQLTAPPPEQFVWGVKGDTHLLVGSGFLDDALFNRTVWQYGLRIDRSQLLAIDGTDVYGLRVYEGISWNCPVHHVGDGHLIFRQDVSRPVPKPRPQDLKRLNRIPTERYAWHTRVPIRVSAMLLSGDPAERLFVAGVPDEVAPDDPPAFIEGRRGARLLVLDAQTGEQTAQMQLDAPPVWDGMAAAYGRLYMATAQGELICLGAL